MSDMVTRPHANEEARTNPVVLIQPTAGWVGLRLWDIWAYRDLLVMLALRDIKVRYKQTTLGIFWIVLQPLATALVLGIVFGRLAKIPSENIPYTLFALGGLAPWNCFSGAFTRGSGSLVASSQLISKVYFPRLIIPLAGILAGLLDLVIVLLMLVGMTLFSGMLPTLRILALPLLVVLLLATALGTSLWLSALNVRYRDVGLLVPFLAQFWMYATPVLYPGSLIPERWHSVYAVNPMVGVVEGFRWALFDTGSALQPALVSSVIVSAILLVSGAFFFRRVEREFADVI